MRCFGLVRTRSGLLESVQFQVFFYLFLDLFVALTLRCWDICLLPRRLTFKRHSLVLEMVSTCSNLLSARIRMSQDVLTLVRNGGLKFGTAWRFVDGVPVIGGVNRSEVRGRGGRLAGRGFHF